MRPSFAAAIAACALTLLPGVPAGGAAAGQGATVALEIRDQRVVESSGLAASPRHAGVLWTHNDSGDTARLFAVGPDGGVLATLTLAGVEARDWEAIAAGRDDAGRPALFVGDIGDNRSAWPSVSVYRLGEPPSMHDATLAAKRYQFRYADGPRDAEALLVDPRDNRLYVASKEADSGGLYQAPAKLRTDRVNLLRRIAEVPPSITDGAFSPDGRAFVLRDYSAAYVFAAPGRQVGAFALPLQRQGESITWSPDGDGVLVGSEGQGSEIWRVGLPDEAAPRGTATSASPHAPASSLGGGDPVTALPVGWAASALLLVLAGSVALLVARMRRRRSSESRKGVPHG
jgi:hypothetical protein